MHLTIPYPRLLAALCLALTIACTAVFPVSASPAGTTEPAPMSLQDDDDDGGSAASTAAPLAATPRPVLLRAGSCDDLGGAIAPLSNLSSPVGDDDGQDDASVVEYAFTDDLPMALDDLLAGDHALSVHAGDDDTQNHVACGNIGGVVDANGTLVVGLRPHDDSGLAGIAVLTRNAGDDSRTDASVFLTGDRLPDDAGTGGSDGSAPAGGGDGTDDATGDDGTGDDAAGAGTGTGTGGDDDGGDDDGGDD